MAVVERAVTGVSSAVLGYSGVVSATRTDRVVDELLLRHGRTYADEIGADLVAGGPDALFRLLVFALLASTRIRARVAVDACRALADAGWTTPTATARASWADRTRVLNRSGYARYDESTSRRLENVSRHLLKAYGGDLAGLREAAHRNPSEERSRLQEFVGIGPVGADIFLREAQLVWDELRPYVDARTLSTARELGLSDDPAELAALVPAADLVRLVAALVRVRLDHDIDEVRQVVDVHAGDGRSKGSP